MIFCILICLSLVMAWLACMTCDAIFRPAGIENLPASKQKPEPTPVTPCVFCGNPGAANRVFGIKGPLCDECYIEVIKVP